VLLLPLDTLPNRGKRNMQTAATNKVFLTWLMSSMKGFAEPPQTPGTLSHPALYQVILSSLTQAERSHDNRLALAGQLVNLAERSYLFRELETLDSASRLLMQLPLPRQYRSVGCYYQALRLQQFGHGDLDKARRLFERVADDAPFFYRTRAMVSLGANAWHRCDFQTALSLYQDATRLAPRDFLCAAYSTLQARRMIAVAASRNGDHRRSLRLLEDLSPLAAILRTSQPLGYCEYLNSLAIELTEAKRLAEASHFSTLLLSSPFVSGYPEFIETHTELKRSAGRRASCVTVPDPDAYQADNVLHMRAAYKSRGGSGSSRPALHQRARVLAFTKRQAQAAPTAPKQDFAHLSKKQKIIRIVNLICGNMSDDQLARILKYTEVLVGE
jgi:tetratricopeptide (TPR) repeat protein